MIPRIERSKLAGMNCGEVAGHINMLRRTIGMEEIDFRTMKHSLDRLMNRYDRQWEYTRAVVIERKERAEKEKAMAKKKDDKKQTTKPAAKAAAPAVEKKPEAPKLIEITDRLALLALAQVAGWEANDPFIGNSAEDTVTVESDSGETELKAMTDDACKMELGENIGILTPEDQKAVEAMENGEAIWVKFISLREDLTKAKVETTKKETKAAAKAADKASKPAGEKKKGPPAREKNSFGHVVGTMSAVIDDMLSAKGGATEAEVVAKLVKDFKKEDKAASGKFKAHVKFLKAEGFKITETNGKVHLSAK